MFTVHLTDKGSITESQPWPGTDTWGSLEAEIQDFLRSKANCLLILWHSTSYQLSSVTAPSLTHTHTPIHHTVYILSNSGVPIFCIFSGGTVQKGSLGVSRPAVSAGSTWELTENAESQPLHCWLQNLHFIKFSRRFIYTVKFEKHCFSKHPLGFCHRVVSLLRRTFIVDLLAKP